MMRKRWIAVILTGLLSLTGSAVGAEELTGNIVLEKAPETRIDDIDFSLGIALTQDRGRAAGGVDGAGDAG